MVYCRSCGREIEDKANYCPYCGAAVQSQYQLRPVYPYPVQSSDRKVLWIIVAVIVVLIVIPMALSAVLYLMVIGFDSDGYNHSPSAVMSSEMTNNDTIYFTVLVVSDSVDLNDVWVGYWVGGSEGGFNVGLNLPESEHSFQEPAGSTWVSFDDTNSNGILDSGDRVIVTAQSERLPGVAYEIVLRYVPTGENMAQIAYVVP
jgi:hypothetical protein